MDLEQEVQSLMSPIAPSGSAIVGTVEDLQAQTRIKVQRARQVVDTTFDLLGFDLLEGSLWMDVRKKQDPRRSFGEPATAAWTAFRGPCRSRDRRPVAPKPIATGSAISKRRRFDFYRGFDPRCRAAPTAASEMPAAAPAAGNDSGGASRGMTGGTGRQ